MFPYLGTFALGGAAGNWTLPGSLTVVVDGDGPNTGWSIDSSVPNPSIPGMLFWSGTSEISPSAQLTDTASVALLQDWIVVFAVGFGIGGAMLASLLFEWIRPEEHHSKASDQRNLKNSGEPINGVRQPHRMKHWVPTRFNRWLVLLGLTFIVGYVRRRQRRHKS